MCPSGQRRTAGASGEARLVAANDLHLRSDEGQGR
jgi:hypothetical protein